MEPYGWGKGSRTFASLWDYRTATWWNACQWLDRVSELVTLEWNDPKVAQTRNRAQRTTCEFQRLTRMRTEWQKLDMWYFGVMILIFVGAYLCDVEENLEYINWWKAFSLLLLFDLRDSSEERRLARMHGCIGEEEEESESDVIENERNLVNSASWRDERFRVCSFSEILNKQKLLEFDSRSNDGRKRRKEWHYAKQDWH